MREQMQGCLSNFLAMALMQLSDKACNLTTQPPRNASRGVLGGQKAQGW
jgi:hypothetical protein